MTCVFQVSSIYREIRSVGPELWDFDLMILSELLYFVLFMLEHAQIPISHEQYRAKLDMQSTVFRSECRELPALELEKLHFFAL